MSDVITSESPSPPPKVQFHNKPDLFSDVALWRKKKLNLFIILCATASWIVMEVYEYHFITVLSWVGMATVTCLFFWGSIHRLLKKEEPDLSELEISEETAMEHANAFEQWAEEVIRLMFHVSSEREWFVFGGVVALLYLIAVVARHFDFLTLVYIGVLMGLTVPVMYVRNERKITVFVEKLRIRSQRTCSMIKHKFEEIKNKIVGQHKEIKDKKRE